MKEEGAELTDRHYQEESKGCNGWNAEHQILFGYVDDICKDITTSDQTDDDLEYKNVSFDCVRMQG